ncbi:hypothetical protein F7Q99_37585 [Streptomyces kaniharaensis]|uniref:DUF6777 domain-containing protein n=1 Tax=Streptomyces kaniharaensis TaxID=212423 RepID=A0A6N7L2A6_9ACTN|nr:hypothetical protein [Streptomyces kaniharaensis]
MNGQGGHNEMVPAANEVALQTPTDPGPDPFTQSVETTAVSAAPTTSQPQQPKHTTTSAPALHSVQGSSSGLYAGTKSKPACDTARLTAMVSAGAAGKAWASAAGIDQSAIPAYLHSLTTAYLRVDTRVTNHGYKSGAVTEYQSVLQAGTAVLVDAQGVPRVRCSCGNPLKPPTLVTNATYTGKAWTGFQPSTLIIVVPAPQPVTELILVNVETGGWFARLTGRIEVVDRTVEPPKGPLAPGIPPAAPMMPGTPSASSSTSTSGTTSSGSTSATTSGSTSTSSKPSSSPATKSSPPSSTASSSSSTGTPTTTTATTSTATVTSSAATKVTPTATCATTAPSTLPPCTTTSTATVT